MIIGLSIVDLHKPAGKRHVGTIMIEVDYPGDSHFEIATKVAPVENEERCREEGLNILRTAEHMRALGHKPQHLDGTPA